MTVDLRRTTGQRLGTVSEPARQVDVIHTTDVLVVGSGPAGLAAALAAARSGVEVTLVERFGCFGGNITTVGVEGLAWYRHEATVEANGIGREFEDRAHAMGAAVPESQSQSYELDAEGFKVVADVLVQEAGIHPMLHRAFVAPVMDGDRVVGIITESKAGREAILARRVIDCTGDADIAHRAGAPTHHPPRERLMAASVMFHIAGVDKRRFVEGVAADPQTYKDWAGNGEWSIETSGKEDDMFSPFLHKPFKAALDAGLIPADLTTTLKEESQTDELLNAIAEEADRTAEGGARKATAKRGGGRKASARRGGGKAAPSDGIAGEEGAAEG